MATIETPKDEIPSDLSESELTVLEEHIRKSKRDRPQAADVFLRRRLVEKLLIEVRRRRKERVAGIKL